ncbi:MAG: RagB/SusD family nutrient uptake outer membrane protein, partial [Prevotellaceae bacterium]|nr:RagB/SusD family nutrient uptake outer membrane protein [Prevotellaceae bacterium]
WWCTGNEGSNTQNAAYLARGVQNINDPYLNFWDGRASGKNLFVAIRDCNIFLENIHTPTDIEEIERAQWIAEVKFLKAYYHFYLLQLYGPIPIIRENLPVNATSEEVRIYREPVDEVVDYIVELLDEAIPDLLLNTVDSKANDAGRIAQPTAAAIKAKALVLAASPLFNGTESSPPQFSLVDKRGVELFPRTYSAAKWTRAAEAVREAIEISHEAGHSFNKYVVRGANIVMSPETELKCALRAAITEKFNTEIIWPSVASTSSLQNGAVLPWRGYHSSITPAEFAVTLKVAEQFYTKNGLPIEEDSEWIEWVGENLIQRYAPIQVSNAAGSGIDGISSLSDDHKYYITSNEITAKLHCYREPRFYAWIGFDRCLWEMNGETNDTKSWAVKMRAGDQQGSNATYRYSITGYIPKKLVQMDTDQNADKAGFQYIPYTYPIIRLSDLYLLYAETLNESKQTPDAEVYRWIDSVRLRAGLQGVVDTWNTHAVSGQKAKPTRKDGMRDIIKRERLIELSFESQRFFDLLRWKDALQYLNEPVRGWNTLATQPDLFYTVTTYWDRRVFNTKDYFWPLRLETLQINSNLKQNPGW